MFTQLMPLIQNRALTLTVTAISTTEIRVNVVPQPSENDKKPNSEVAHSHEKEVAKIPEKAIRGLTTPLCLTGTPEEIDAELKNTLTQFTALHQGLQQSFDGAATAIKEAVKAIDERERLKREKDKANSKKQTPAKAEEQKPVEDAALPLLFTTQGEKQPAAASEEAPATTPALPAASATVEL